jgi:lipoprotein signal peptidase
MNAAWIATVIIAVGVLSFAFVGQNKFYNFIEKSAVGFTVGHTTVAGLNALRTSTAKVSAGSYLLLVPIALGLLYFFKFGKKAWTFLATYPTCLIIGAGIGLGLRTVIQTEILKQVIATASLPLLNLNNLLIVVVVVSVVLMFTFTEKLSRTFAPPALRVLGRWFVLFTLGVLWSNQAFDRLSVLSGVVVKGILQPFLK